MKFRTIIYPKDTKCGKGGSCSYLIEREPGAVIILTCRRCGRVVKTSYIVEEED